MTHALPSLVLGKLREQVDRLDHLLALVPPEALSWQPPFPSSATPVTELLGHLLECLAGVSGIRVIGTGAYPEVLALARRRHPWLGTLQKPFAVAQLEAWLSEEAA